MANLHYIGTTGICSSPQISKYLDMMVKHVADALTPFLNITTPIYPETALSNRTAFLTKGRLIIRPSDLISEDDISLAHEVTHFIHYVANRSIFKLYRQDPQASNLCELVAFYGSLIFYNMARESLQEPKRQLRNIFEDLPDCTKQALSHRVTEGEEGRKSYDGHRAGERIADWFFKKYGSDYFRDFAEADIDAAERILLTEGYPGELFVPSLDEEEYLSLEEVDGELVTALNLCINTWTSSKDIQLRDIKK